MSRSPTPTPTSPRPRQAAGPSPKRSAIKPANADLLAGDLTATAQPACASALTNAPRTTKKAALLILLQQPQGASLDQIITLTQWQPHTARAALTRLRQQGHDIIRAPGDDAGPPRYRIPASDRDAVPAERAAAAGTNDVDAGDVAADTPTPGSAS